MGTKNHRETTIERTSERELVVTRMFNAPARLVYEAWTTPALFMRWWGLKAIGVPMLACEMEVRVGGRYRIAYGHDASSAMAFFGTYLEVVPNERLVWTNEEDPNASVTTVTFEDHGEATLLVLRELYPSKQAFDDGAGAEAAFPEQFAQLDELLAEIGAGEA